uniref:Uncharacterized protein n=1 Tax=Ananas comosus var. bracteatus TaxID=296719 RepID=A0A6V7NYS3_ANACO|nr:unnamed protein product [Ananas comosus var. bracteatus]
MDSNIISANLPEVKSLMYKQSSIPSKISAIKGNNIKESRPFIVSDIETILVDSCTLLPSSLASLGRTLCPELGPKGSIPHKDLVVSDLQAQEINWSKYQIDIEDVMTVSALSLKIFRKKYFDNNSR